MEVSQVHGLQRRPDHIDAADVTGPDRTLVYGYERHSEHGSVTMHVYKLDGELYVHKYVNGYSSRPTQTESHVSGTTLEAIQMTPSKRAYPEQTCYAFARQMAMTEHPLCFTTCVRRQ